MKAWNERLYDFLINRYSDRQPGIIIGNEDNPYLYRWYVIPRNPYFNIYFHCFKRSDDDRALHCHPWWNVSIILEGDYDETVFVGGAPEFLSDGAYVEAIRNQGRKLFELPPTKIIRRNAGAIAFRRGRVAHRVILDEFAGNVIPVWTLFITGPRVRQWGFFCPKGWRHWKEFVHNREGVSEVGQGCGEH